MKPFKSASFILVLKDGKHIVASFNVANIKEFNEWVKAELRRSGYTAARVTREAIAFYFAYDVEHGAYTISEVTTLIMGAKS